MLMLMVKGNHCPANLLPPFLKTSPTLDDVFPTVLPPLRALSEPLLNDEMNLSRLKESLNVRAGADLRLSSPDETPHPHVTGRNTPALGQGVFAQSIGDRTEA